MINDTYFVYKVPLGLKCRLCNFKAINTSEQEGLDYPARSLDRWLSHQLSSQLTYEREDHGGPTALIGEDFYI